MLIRKVEAKDYDAIWQIFHPIVSIGETYAYPTNCTKDEAIKIWCQLPEASFVAELDGRIIGTYYLKANQLGPGSHVCNCGYMVADEARGKGVATAMCEHSQEEARLRGYKAMQFNLVVSSNTGAIKLWQKLGFEIVGEIPKAFQHPTKGLINAFVMYKLLKDK
jgi:ribosomal protein S18 acetylase RimI-like enzyme